MVDFLRTRLNGKGAKRRFAIALALLRQTIPGQRQFWMKRQP